MVRFGVEHATSRGQQFFGGYNIFCCVSLWYQADVNSAVSYNVPDIRCVGECVFSASGQLTVVLGHVDRHAA